MLPYPEDIPPIMKERELFWIDKDRKFMHQKDWKRPITAESFFLNEKLVWMEQNRIDHAVVLTLSQLYGNGMSYEDMKVALRFQNDFNASIQHAHPTKFTCGFVVHPGYVDGAIKEIKRCVKELDLSMICLPTHYLDQEGKWKTIFNEETDAIFEMVNHYGIAMEIHPYDGEKFIQLENTAWRFHLVWMLAQCADAYHFLTLFGYQERFPRIRYCFAHGGQLAQINLGRRIQGFDGRPDLFPGMMHPRKAVGHPNIFFDTLVHDTHSLELMIKRQGGTDQIMIGLDDPYPLGEMESEAQTSYPGKILDLAVEESVISEIQREQMWSDNVLRWLGVEDNEKLAARILHK